MFYDELAAFINEAATIEGLTADMKLDMKHKLLNVAFSRGVVAKRATIEGSIREPGR